MTTNLNLIITDLNLILTTDLNLVISKTTAGLKQLNGLVFGDQAR